MTASRLALDYKSSHRVLEISVPDGAQAGQGWAVMLGDFLAVTEIPRQHIDDAFAKNQITEAEPSDWLKYHIAALPERIEGTVLDIGGYDGLMASECLKRGAVKASCWDSMQFTGYTLPSFGMGWQIPPKREGVNYVLADISESSTWPPGEYPSDLVLCFNLIYHVPDPLQAIVNLRTLTRRGGQLLIATSYWKDGSVNAWQFKPDASRTMFWTPTKTGLVTALEFAGFTCEQVGEWQEHSVIYRCV